ncbi:hypothetical protein CALCODRAFT_479264 [Calocera cornea HHB12733]|uniref:Uncharacterized protein n=1 Tax=Calocera cornea HHB12733 TaxID=1353952 RepID=A0A165JX12_9BASI|nr:hypothetical protein CALCODRAFT_479264 [Calocera cornea HHB12733]
MSTLALLCPTLHRGRARAHAARALTTAAPLAPSESSTQGRARERRLLTALRSFRKSHAKLIPSAGPPAPRPHTHTAPTLRPDYFSHPITRSDAYTQTFLYRRLAAALDSPYAGNDWARMAAHHDILWDSYTALCHAVSARALPPLLHRRVLLALIPNQGPWGDNLLRLGAAPAGPTAAATRILHTLDHRLLALLARMRDAATPQTEDYNAALWVCRFTGRYHTALALRDAMRRDAVPPDEATFSHLLDAFFSRHAGAPPVRPAHESHHIAPLVHTILADMSALGRALAPTLLDRIARLLRELDARTELDTLFREHYGFDLRHPDRVAHEFWKNKPPDAQLPGVSSNALNQLLFAYSWRREPWNALVAFEVLSGPLPPRPALAPRSTGDPGTGPAYEEDDEEDEDGDEPAARGPVVTEHPLVKRRAWPTVITYDTLLASATFAQDVLLTLHFLCTTLSDERRVHARALARFRTTGRLTIPRMRLSTWGARKAAELLANKHRAADLRWLQDALAQLVRDRWRRAREWAEAGVDRGVLVGDARRAALSAVREAERTAAEQARREERRHAAQPDDLDELLSGPGTQHLHYADPADAAASGAEADADADAEAEADRALAQQLEFQQHLRDSEAEAMRAVQAGGAGRAQALWAEQEQEEEPQAFRPAAPPPLSASAWAAVVRPEPPGMRGGEAQAPAHATGTPPLGGAGDAPPLAGGRGHPGEGLAQPPALASSPSPSPDGDIDIDPFHAPPHARQFRPSPYFPRTESDMATQLYMHLRVMQKQTGELQQFLDSALPPLISNETRWAIRRDQRHRARRTAQGWEELMRAVRDKMPGHKDANDFLNALGEVAGDRPAKTVPDTAFKFHNPAKSDGR